MKAHSGPLPAPEDFREYEAVQKGAADRIIKMAERALEAEIRMGYWAAATQFVSMFLGKFFVYALGGVSVFLLINGYEIAALLTGLGPIAQAVASSVDSFKDKEKKPKKKTKTKQAPAPEKTPA